MSELAALPSIHEAPPTAKAYLPMGAALEVMLAKQDEILTDGPAGTGKSRGCLEKLHLCGTKYAGMRGLIVRKTRASLTQSAMVTFEKFVVPNDGRVTWRASDQEYRYWNGSTIVVGGMDKSSRIMSTEYDLIYVQEATELTEGEYEDLTTRLRNGIMPYQQIVSDCNPSHAHHWLMRRVNSGVLLRYPSIHQDNPKLYNPITKTWTKEGEAYIQKLARLTGLRGKRLYQGLWVAAEGIIYEDFGPNHLVPAPPKLENGYLFCTVDFGYSNPFVCQWWWVDYDNRMFLIKEIYHTKRTVTDHAAKIAEVNAKFGLEPEIFVCDWDAEDRATLEQAGFPTVPADKAVSLGIDRVQERLKVRGNNKPGLLLVEGALVEPDPDLQENYLPICTQDEFLDYSWAENKQSTLKKDQPVKLHDHGMDAMRYAVMWAENRRSTGGIFV